jgi:excisionase family DNA binding protein
MAGADAGYLTPREAAAELGVSYRTILSSVASGEIVRR